MEHSRDIEGLERGTSLLVRRMGVPSEPRSTLYSCWGVCEGQLPDSWPVALPDRGKRSGGVALLAYYPEPAPWHYFECPGCLLGGKPAWYYYSYCPGFDGAPYAKRLSMPGVRGDAGKDGARDGRRCVSWGKEAGWRRLQ